MARIPVKLFIWKEELFVLKENIGFPVVFVILIYYAFHALLFGLWILEEVRGLVVPLFCLGQFRQEGGFSFRKD